MTEISNIDAIIELIMREARARKVFSLVTRIYNVHREVSERINEIMCNVADEERKENKKDKQAEWAKGM